MIDLYGLILVCHQRDVYRDKLMGAENTLKRPQICLKIPSHNSKYWKPVYESIF